MTKTPTARIAALAIACSIAAATSYAAQPKEPARPIDYKAFFAPELAISSSNTELREALPTLANRAAWESFLAGSRDGFANGADISVFIDPRSGAAVNIIGAYPLIPGHRRRQPGDPGQPGRAWAPRSRGGRRAWSGTPSWPSCARHQATCSASTSRQLGRRARHAGRPTDLWQVNIPQALDGVPVRHGRAGGLHQPRQPGDHRHRDLGRRAPSTPHARGDQPPRRSTPASPTSDGRQPRTSCCGTAAPGDRARGAAGAPERRGLRRARSASGYGHRLVWTFVFQRPPDARALGGDGGRPQRRGARAAGHEPLRRSGRSRAASTP